MPYILYTILKSLLNQSPFTPTISIIVSYFIDYNNSTLSSLIPN